MHFPVFVLTVFAIVIAVTGTLMQAQSKTGQARVKPKLPFATPREQAMFQKLIATWNDGYVLAQVAMGAVISAPTRAERNQFDRKILDFVLTDRAFQVKVIIELDDRSHNTKREADQKRDQLLAKAGYAVHRFPNIPDPAELDAVLRPFTSEESSRRDHKPGPAR